MNSKSNRKESTSSHDQIEKETRWVGLLIIPFLIVASAMLYIWPDQTDRLFAWTIQPPMTALLMGSGYIGGLYFFARVARARQWHQVAAGFLAVTGFAALMGIATALHWDRFHHDHISFFAWASLYATTPFIIFGVWLRNRRADPSIANPHDRKVPVLVRWGMGIAGAVILLVGLLLFSIPELMIPLWPWQLSALTARVVGGFFTLPGVGWLVLARDPRWSAAKVFLESQFIGIVLILVGAARAWGDFDPGNAATAIFIGGMSLLALAILGFYVAMESGEREVHEPYPNKSTSGKLF
ncbi:MAG TPA: hypothetical protein VE136_10210 [Anaerolineales bacterium]|nr:hypothetical protein [Anaerolineales bacterium]